MPLAPTDVHNVAFSRSPIGECGYNEDEVDQFLDLAEDTLGEPQNENAELRQRTENLEKQLEQDGGANYAVSGIATVAPAVDEDELRKEIERELYAEYNECLSVRQQEIEAHYQGRLNAPKKRAPETEASTQQTSSASTKQPQAVAAGTDTESQEISLHAVRILQAAQDVIGHVTTDANAEINELVTETHKNTDHTVAKVNGEIKRTVTNAHNKADTTLANAKERGEQLLADARNKFELTPIGARQRSEQIVSDADARSNAITTTAQQGTTALQGDTECKRHGIVAVAEEQQTALENRIEELHIFEHGYHTRLKTFLRSQLDDLNSRESATPADGHNN